MSYLVKRSQRVGRKGEKRGDKMVSLTKVGKGFLRLPELVINAVVAVVLLLLLSFIAGFFPAIGAFIVGVVLLIAGLLFQDIYLDRKKSFSLAIPLVIMGVGIILVNFLGLSLGLFSVVAGTIASRPMSVVGDGSTLEMLGISAGLIGSLLVVIVGTTFSAVLTNKYLLKPKRRR